MSGNGNLLVIGAGLTGLSAAYHLKKPFTIFEKEPIPGGMASSETVGDFTFDKTGHLLHPQGRYVKDLLHTLCNGLKLIKHERSSWVFSKETYTRYPFQVNTYGLPPGIIKDCLIKIADTQREYLRERQPANFKEWVLANFGEGIAKHFMFPYNRKMWKMSLENMEIDWAERFVPKTDLKQAIRGAVTDYRKKIGYSKVFYYPQRGGIQEIADLLYKHINGQTYFGQKALRIDLRNKKVIFDNGKRVKFHTLVSTVPLPELSVMIEDLPKNISSSLKKLAYVSMFNLNIGINRSNLSDKHWAYFPEGKYIFYRIGFFSNLSENLAPKGTSSIYTEVSYRGRKPLGYNKEQLEERIISDLKKAKVLNSKDEIIAKKSYDIKYSYPIHDKNRRECVDKIKDFLRGHNIYSIGRYGSWRYMTMEESILEGRFTAELINNL